MPENSRLKRPALMRGAETALVPTLLTTDPELDPVFAAIERHRSLSARHLEAWCRFDEAENNIKRALDTAERALADVKPRTAAGAGALVAYVQADLDGNDLPDWAIPALGNVAEALTTMVS